jgi:hypothetical protein
MHDLAAPPVHPQPSIYETTVINVPQQDGPDLVVTHRDIEQIVARPRWDFAEADARLTVAHLAKNRTRRGKRQARGQKKGES